MGANHLQVIENEQQPKVVEYVPSIAQTVDQAAENLKQMYALARKVMRYKVDYDTIPGTPKPSLLKPGAERLLQFFGLGHEVKCVNKIEDWEKGFFFYHYKVTITHPNHPGFVVAECEGSCNSKESKYAYRWVSAKEAQAMGLDLKSLPSKNSGNYTKYRVPNDDIYSQVNTIQKMAIKRALVGATLQATGASGLFTQDIEDNPEAFELSDPEQQQPQTNNTEQLATEKQIKAIHATANEKNISDEELKALYAKVGKSSAKELTRKEASQLIDYLKSRPKQEQTQKAEYEDVYKSFERELAGGGK